MPIIKFIKKLFGLDDTPPARETPSRPAAPPPSAKRDETPPQARPPAAKAEDKPAAAKPKAATKSKAPAKAKTAAKKGTAAKGKSAKAAAKPKKPAKAKTSAGSKTVAKAKPAAKPKTATQAKPAAKSKVAAKPAAAAKPKAAAAPAAKTAARPKVAAKQAPAPAAKTTADAKPARSTTTPAKGAAASLKADYVIVGAGPAGVAACETLRGIDKSGTILLLSGEAAPPYSRMAIPYMLTGLIDEPGTYLRKADGHYDNQSIKVHHGNVDSVDAVKKTLKLSDGSTCSYGKLLIATGASPIRPPVKGLDLPAVHHCWTLEDARSIVKHADKGSNVVLMGAGFIGCIILEALVARGTNLTVVEAEDRMVPRMMNATAGNLIKKWCEEKGMTVHTSTRVTEISKDGAKLIVDMDNGQSATCVLVVVATGVAANVGFLKGSGVELNEGVKVNDRLESSVKGIYAAGDCAEGPDFSTGGWSVHAIQPTAAEHGRIAALNMAGQDAIYKGSLNMNVLDTAGLISSSFGEWQGVAGGDVAESSDSDHYRYTHLAFDGDMLVGALTLGRTENIGILRGLIQSRTSLGEWKDRLMQDPNRITEAYIANTHQ